MRTAFLSMSPWKKEAFPQITAKFKSYQAKHQPGVIIWFWMILRSCKISQNDETFSDSLVFLKVANIFSTCKEKNSTQSRTKALQFYMEVLCRLQAFFTPQSIPPLRTSASSRQPHPPYWAILWQAEGQTCILLSLPSNFLWHFKFRISKKILGDEVHGLHRISMQLSFKAFYSLQFFLIQAITTSIKEEVRYKHRNSPWQKPKWWCLISDLECWKTNTGWLEDIEGPWLASFSSTW